MADTMTMSEVTSFIDNLKSSYEKTEDAIGTIYRTFTGERCVHGQNVPASNVSDIPDWADVCSDYGGGSYVVENGVRKLGLTSPEQWKGIAHLDPIAGIANQGTAFAQLSDPQKRSYFSNAAAIAIAQNVSDLSGYKPKWDELVKLQADLGWKLWKTDEHGPFTGERNQKARSSGIDPVTGLPMVITVNDMNAAIARLSAPDIKQISAPGTQFGAQSMTATAGTPTAQDLQACLTIPYAQRSNCVRDILKANPGLAALYEATQDPWKEVADPNKMVQGVYGLNGKHYTVVKIGQKQYAMRTLYITVGAATSAAAVAAAVAATAIVLFATKGGKKWRKKYLKF